MSDLSSKAESTGVGVVIPVYNRKKLLQEALGFVVAQTLSPQKLVIVDDGSVDDTAEAAERWLAAEPRPFEWSVIRTPHRSAAAARNTGFAEVGHLPYVAFLDSDDQWPRDFLERTSNRLSTSVGAVAVSTDRQFFAKRGAYLNLDLSGLEVDPQLWLFQSDAGIASCSLFTSSAIRNAGGWIETLESGEDFRLFVLVAQQGAWLHSPGDPVRFNRGSERTHGEEMNLSKRRPGMHREWAEMAEHIYEEIREDDPIRDHSLRQAISRKWTAAGNHFVRMHRISEANAAYDKAISWCDPGRSLVMRSALTKGFVRLFNLQVPGQ